MDWELVGTIVWLVNVSLYSALAGYTNDNVRRMFYITMVGLSVLNLHLLLYYGN